jgi:hypothetical protein
LDVCSKLTKIALLSDVTDDLIKAGRQLKDVDQAKFEAISAFASCGDIVSWLRKNVEGKILFKIQKAYI